MYLLSTVNYCIKIVTWNIPLVIGSNVWVCGQYLAGFTGSNPKGAFMSVLSVVCCHVQVAISD